MSLSSSTVVHFTNQLSTLKLILEEGFKPKYCKESFSLDNDKFIFYVPMISFCDIPLSEIKDHIGKYGSYGIGLTKEWAKRNGLNPVFYIEQNSYISRHLVRLIHKVADDNETGTPETDKLLDIFRYIKNYEGDLIRQGRTINNYRYSDEREWRHIPYNEDVKFIFFEESEKSEYEDSLSDIRLTFSPNDIRYIFIKDDSELEEVILLIQNTLGKTWTYHEVSKLMTRIFTSEQVMHDI